MGEVLTSDEVLKEAISAMGSPLGEIYHALGDEVAWLCLKWNDFRELFAGRETVELLNAAAPAYFHDLQRQTWEDILLHLCRLTDPPESGRKRKPNLTILRLPDLAMKEDLRGELRRLVNHARKKTDFARDWRNRRLAHKELALEHRQPLASASVRHVEDALVAIRSVINRLEESYLNKTVSYEGTIAAVGGVASFIAVLRKGVEARRAERAAKLRGHVVT